MKAGKRRDDKEGQAKAEAAHNQFAALISATRGKPGSWLVKWRLAHNYTQAALAAALDVSERSVIRWERREELPRLVTLILEGR